MNSHSADDEVEEDELFCALSWEKKRMINFFNLKIYI